MPYHFSLVHRRSTSSECRACRNPILSEQNFHTIVVRWEQEFNELDFVKHAMIITFKSILNPMISLYQPSSQDYLNFCQKNLMLDHFFYIVIRIIHL
jgi:hypothetical protein